MSKHVKAKAMVLSSYDLADAVLDYPADDTDLELRLDAMDPTELIERVTDNMRQSIPFCLRMAEDEFDFAKGRPHWVTYERALSRASNWWAAAGQSYRDLLTLS
jgi:hypothetical protein